MSGQLATGACPNPRAEVFITGSQPIESCHLHGGGGRTQVAGWDNLPPEPEVQPAQERSRSHAVRNRSKAQEDLSESAPGETPTPAKKGLFGRIKDIFK